MIRLLKNVSVGFGTATELIRSLWNGPSWWLVPVMLLLLPTAVIFIFLEAVPLVAPFVYTMF